MIEPTLTIDEMRDADLLLCFLFLNSRTGGVQNLLFTNYMRFSEQNLYQARDLKPTIETVFSTATQLSMKPLQVHCFGALARIFEQLGETNLVDLNLGRKEKFRQSLNMSPRDPMKIL